MEKLRILITRYAGLVLPKIKGVFEFLRQWFMNQWRSHLKGVVYRFYLVIRVVVAIALFIFIVMALVAPAAELVSLPYRAQITPDTTLLAEQVKLEKALQREVAQLERRMNAFTPVYPYMIINTTENKFFVFKGQKLMMEGKCSTGSYIHLVTDTDQSWIFKTPRGVRRINGKTTNPVWRKPDWAFVEEGLPIPSPFHHSRFEYGVLGDYALSLGDGYLIHGTIYKRQLGMPVTHGCVRLNDDDLEYIYRNLEIGSKVYIY